MALIPTVPCTHIDKQTTHMYTAEQISTVTKTQRHENPQEVLSIFSEGKLQARTANYHNPFLREDSVTGSRPDTQVKE